MLPALRRVSVALQGSPGRFCHHFLSFSFLLTCPLPNQGPSITMAKAPMQNPRLHLNRRGRALGSYGSASHLTRLSTNWPLLTHLGDGRLMAPCHPQTSPPRRTPFLSTPKAVALSLPPTGLGSSRLPRSFQGSQIAPLSLPRDSIHHSSPEDIRPHCPCLGPSSGHSVPIKCGVQI